MRDTAEAHADLNYQLVRTMADEIEMLKLLIGEQKEALQRSKSELDRIKRNSDFEVRRLESAMREQSDYGSYLWKIDNFNPENYNNFVGPSFSSSRNGYRFELLMGKDGQRYPNNVGIWVRLISGNYDLLLQWPFQMMVDIRILNQNDHSGESDLVETEDGPEMASDPTNRNWIYMPDRTDRFGRNLPFGEFFPVERLRKPGFVVDNTMLVHVTVRSVNTTTSLLR